MRGARPSYLSQLNFEPLQAHSSLDLFHPTAAISKSEKTQSFDNFNARDLGLCVFSWKIYCCWKTFQAQRTAKEMHSEKWKGSTWDLPRAGSPCEREPGLEVTGWNAIPGAMSTVSREGIWEELGLLQSRHPLLQCLAAELLLWGRCCSPFPPSFSSKIWSGIFTFLTKKPLYLGRELHQWFDKDIY